MPDILNKDWEFPHIVTVKSSAGAGKTYNLALRYLKLLCLSGGADRPPVKSRICNIVAITFTNKAASEMRSRIIDWMKRIILDIPFRGSEESPVDRIEAGLSPEERERLIRVVEADFENLIRNFYDFKVSTIDSFVNLTLKASAFKLGLPPDFDISTESGRYVDAVLEECLQEILEDGEVKDVFDAFIRTYLEMEGADAAWIPKKFLSDTVYRFWKEEAKENKEFLPGSGPARIGEVRKEIVKIAVKLHAILAETEGMKPSKVFMGALTNLTLLEGTGFKGSAFFKRETLAQSMNKGSAPPELSWEQDWQRIRALIALFVEALSESKFSSYLRVYRLFKDRLKTEVTYRMRLILIEELNRLLQDVIAKEAFIPEIYYALAERYTHFLIDEFQDTNHLQWKNIGVLADEALSRGGTLFLVGDKKQAIYRWRGGKAELVDEISTLYPAYTTYHIPLDTNYRSGEHVIAFNNTIFDGENLVRLLESLAGKGAANGWDRILDTYQGSGQLCLPERKGNGYVRVERMVRENGEGEMEETFLKDERDRIVSDRVEALVKELREVRGYRDRDVAILVRRKQEAELVVKKLLEAGIGVDSEFTVNVRNNPLMAEIIGFLRFLSSPHDDSTLAGFLTGAIFSRTTGRGRDKIMEWLEDERLAPGREPLYRAFQRAYESLWEGYFADLYKGAGYLPLYELFLLAVKRWKVLDHFPEEAPYFLHVCEMIKNREGEGDNNLTGFLAYWAGDGSAGAGEDRDEAPFLLKSAEGSDGVRVLTIHKAKGLQFPVVILPFLKLAEFGAADRRDKGKFFAEEEDGLTLLHIRKEYTEYSERLKRVYLENEADYLVDEINNTYVACTRAEEELYILLTDSGRQKNHLVDYLFGIAALLPCIKDNVLEMGERRDSREPALPVKEERLPVPWERETGDLRWMEKVRGKFEPPENCSRDQVYAKKKGDLIHYILSLITFLPEEYDQEAVAGPVRLGLRRFGLMEREEEIMAALVRFFDHPPFRRFFLASEGAVVYTEKELVNARGDAFKADRIVIRGDHVEVVDFKTGETRKAEHRDQIRNYGRLLESIHEGMRVDCHILYMDERKVESL